MGRSEFEVLGSMFGGTQCIDLVFKVFQDLQNAIERRRLAVDHDLHRVVVPFDLNHHVLRGDQLQCPRPRELVSRLVLWVETGLKVDHRLQEIQIAQCCAPDISLCHSSQVVVVA